MNNHLFSTYQLGDLRLQNRIVMSPMTRSRATGNIPNALMARYYSQRASAGLIITEGVATSPNALGYTNIPGIFSPEQVEAWKPVTHAVHQNGGKIFAQMMHTGRISHPDNLPAGASVLAPSAVRAETTIWTSKGMRELPVPKAMSIKEIKTAQREFADAAKNAIDAGFDGVELHGANGYLLEQFISPATNLRNDEYGGTIVNRGRFVIETVNAVVAAIGSDRVGIRLSPFNQNNDMPVYDEISETYLYLADKLNETGIVYLHLLDNKQPDIPLALKKEIGKVFSQTIILAGNYDRDGAEDDLHSGLGNLVAFGRPFVNNPDLVTRFRNNWPLADNLDTSTFFTPGEAGYIDYQPYQDNVIAV